MYLLVINYSADISPYWLHLVIFHDLTRHIQAWMDGWPAGQAAWLVHFVGRQTKDHGWEEGLLLTSSSSS